MERVDSDAGMRGSYINLLTISRADTGTVNGGTTVFAGTAAELPPLTMPFCGAMWQNL
jgi:hypothetical protein